MKKLILCLLLLLPLTCSAAELHLDYIAAIDPPHHESINGRWEQALAERYYLEIKPSITLGRLTYYVAGITYGLQEWHSTEWWGSDYDYWTNPDAWKPEKFRYAVRNGGTFDLIGDKLQIYSEYYVPVDRRTSHSFYYWRVGISGRIF